MRALSLNDRLALQDLVHDFAQRVDLDGGVGTENLFTEDGFYEYDGRSNRGRDDIRRAYEIRRERGVRTARHVFTNLVLWRKDSGGAAGRSIMMLFAADGPPPIDGAAPIVVGDVLDQYAEVDGHFLIAHRVITPVFVEPGRPAILPLGYV